MKKLILGGMLIALTMASAEDEITKAKAQLARELELIKIISPDVKRRHLARLMHFKMNIEAVQASIAEHGISHTATFLAYHDLIVSFKYSVAFFREIESAIQRDAIVELLRINDDIMVDRGFDDAPYTQITAHAFSQMHALLVQLTQGPHLEQALKGKLQDLVAPIAKVIAIAKQGDRPRTFEAAIPVYKEIEKLYPEFNRIARSHAAFDVILEIQGLNEFYAEFAQIEPAEEP